MGRFLDALTNKKSYSPNTPDPATIAQPVPVANVIEPPSDLTSSPAAGMSRASSGWPTILDALNIKLVNTGWRKNNLREVSNRNTLGNYGNITSNADFGFRYQAFKGIGGLPPMNVPTRPTYNDLIPIVWGTRVPNNNTATTYGSQKGPISVQTTPTTWETSSAASLNRNGPTLL